MNNEEKILEFAENMSCKDLIYLIQKMRYIAEIKEAKEKETIKKEIKQAFKTFYDLCDKYDVVALVGNEEIEYRCISDPDLILDLRF